MPRFCVNLSLMFTDTALPERFARAAKAGFRAVEIQFPYGVPPADIAAAAARAGTRILLINAPVADSLPGLAGTVGYEARFRSGMAEAALYARILGVEYVNVLAGVRREGAEGAVCLAQLRRSLDYAAGVLAGHGVRVCLEAVNTRDVPGYLVPDIDAAASVLTGCTSGNIGLLFDVYHAARMGIDVPSAFRRHLHAIAHVQFADCPGRHEPGTGDIGFDAFFASLDDCGYAGWASAEYVPAGETEAGLAWMEKYGDRVRE